ncbi:hypothetical protein [Micromonospora sp. DH14]|uniref:hypothetical protein n=1 Tax=Micromonospora sp. DH14 TaxID=3040120 RepID=UPI002443581E|nr:hypothetical protein [Micromonospora sp. DH14]MDG9675598.1 hypothetical protein [Micromonospora sp. DH14]
MQINIEEPDATEQFWVWDAGGGRRSDTAPELQPANGIGEEGDERGALPKPFA